MNTKRKEIIKSKKRHVVPEQGRWAVKAIGTARALSLHTTQAEAIEAAKKAIGKDTQIVIHGRDGRVRQTLSNSRADEAMMRVWKRIHAENSTSHSRTRKAS